MSIEDETEAAELPDIPELPGWKSLPAIGDDLHVSRQRIFQMGLKERKFSTIHKIPGGLDPVTRLPRRPMGYVVAESEVDEFLALQRAATAASDAAPADEAIAS
jgi:hypothetical protein